MSTFIDMCDVVSEEVAAGRISAVHAKAQLEINSIIAYNLDLSELQCKMAYNSVDKKRDAKLDAAAMKGTWNFDE